MERSRLLGCYRIYGPERDYAKLWILSLHQERYKISSVVKYLVLEDDIIVSKQSVWLFLKQYSERGTITRKEGSGLPRKLSPAALEVIDTAMRDDELTATQLQSRLTKRKFMCH